MHINYGNDYSFQQPRESPNGYLKSLVIWAERGGMQSVVLGGGHQQGSHTVSVLVAALWNCLFSSWLL